METMPSEKRQVQDPAGTGDIQMHPDASRKKSITCLSPVALDWDHLTKAVRDQFARKHGNMSVLPQQKVRSNPALRKALRAVEMIGWD